MGEERKSGWLSSVVGNISSLWSRSPLDEDKPSHHSFTEIQSDCDFEGEDKSKDASPKFSPDKPTTSASSINEKSRPARYLSPTLLMSSVKPQLNSTKLCRTNIRKRPFTEVTAGSPEVSGDSKNKNRFPASNVFSEDLCTRFNSKKRVCRPSRMLTETVPSLDRSLLDRSVDPLSSSYRDSVNASSLLQSRVSRAPSFTSSALSSKTLAILQQLEKISTPAMEVKKLPFKCRSERWFADERNLSVARSLSNSCARTPSRAQVISNTMSASLPNKLFWHRPNERLDANSKNVADKTFERNNEATSALLSKSQSQEVECDSGTQNNRRKHGPIIKNSDGKSINRLPKVFSAKTLDLEIDSGDTEEIQPLYESWSSNKELSTKVGTPAPGFLGIASKEALSGKSEATSSTEVAEMSCLGDDLFSFARPEKRGPSKHKEETSDEDTSDNSGSEAEDKTAIVSENKKELLENEEKTGGEDAATVKIVPESENEPSVQTKVNTAEEAHLKPSTSDNGNISDETKTSSMEGKIVDASASAAEVDSSEQLKKLSCPTCLVNKEKSASKSVCGGTASPAEIETIAQLKQTASESVSKTAIEQQKPWSCPDCFVSNKIEDEKCVCCGHVRKISEKNEQAGGMQSAAAQKLPSTSQSSAKNVFGDKAFKPILTSGVSFGLKNSQEIASTQNTVQPSATSSAVTVSFGVSENSAPKFGLNSSSSTPNFGSVFSSSQRPSLATVPEGKTMETSGTVFGVSSPLKIPANEVKLSMQEQQMSQSLKNPFAPHVSDSSATSSTPTQQPFASLSGNSSSFGNTNGASTGIPLSTPLFHCSDSFGSKSFNVGNNQPQAATTLSFGSSSIFGTTLPNKTNLEIPKTLTMPNTSLTKDADSVTMASPTLTGSDAAQPITNGGFNFSAAPPSFNFMSNSSTNSGMSSNIFGSLENNTTSNGPTFSFGSSLIEPAKSLSQNTTNPVSAPSLTKVFSAPSTVPPPPSSFNFGSTSSSSGNIFSAPTPTSFNFGASTENPFNTPGASFGSAGSASTNFFNAGTTTSSAPGRKMLKARRTRK